VTNAAGPMQAMLERTLTILRDLDGIDGAGVYVIERSSRNLILEAHIGLASWFTDLVKIVTPSSKQYRLVSRRQALFTPIGELDDPMRTRLAQAGISAMGVIPLLDGECLVGVLNVATTSSDAFPVSTTAFLESVGPILGAAVARLLATVQLLKNGEMLRSIVDSLHDLGFVISPVNAQILHATPSACRVLGYKQEELEEMSVLDLHPEESQKEAERIIQSMVKRDVEYCRLPLRTKGGKLLEAESRVFYGYWEGEDVIFGLVRLASVASTPLETHRLEISLPVTLLDSIPEGIYARDVDGRITYANPALARIHGIPVTELVGRFANDLLVAEDVKQLRSEGILEQLRAGEPVTKSARCYRSDGEIRYLEITATPLNLQSDSDCVLGFVRDVSDRMESLLNTVQTLTDVVHEARTPLTVIKGYADLMTADRAHAERTDADRFASLESISRSADRLAAILEDALAAERLTLPSNSPEIALDLGKLTQRVVGEHRALAELKPVTIDLVCAPGTIVRGDPFLFSKLLGNVLSNAIKYTDNGTICVVVEQSAGRVHVSVCDEGIGIPSDETEKVFQRFYRSRDEAARRRAGSGVGLHIARRIARNYGGDIAIRSELGKGSIVTIDLPGVRPLNDTEESV